MKLQWIITGWGMLILSVILNAAGAFLVKFKINELETFGAISVRAFKVFFWSLLKSPVAVIGAAFLFVAPFPFAVALSRLDISIAYPVQVALNFLLVLLLALMFLGETLSVNKTVSIFLIIVSIYLMYKS